MDALEKELKSLMDEANPDTAPVPAGGVRAPSEQIFSSLPDVPRGPLNVVPDVLEAKLEQLTLSDKGLQL